MKRYRMTLTALTVTGAMAISAAPAAFAQESFQSSGQGGAAGSSWSSSEQGDYITLENTTFYRHSEGWVYEEDQREATWSTELQENSEVIEGLIQADMAQRTATSSGSGFTGENTGGESGGSFGSSELGQITGGENGGNAGGSFGSSDININTEEITEEITGGGNGAGGSSFSFNQESTTTESERTETGGGNASGGVDLTSSNLTAQDWEFLAGLTLPAILMIGGVAWYLNQDGQNYVTDQSRVNQNLSSGEVASSQAMLSSNFDDVVEQAGGSSAGGGNDTATEGQGAEEGNDSVTRGMAAETGNNTLPRALAGLALMSILGAAAFVLRRRFA